MIGPSKEFTILIFKNSNISFQEKSLYRKGGMRKYRKNFGTFKGAKSAFRFLVGSRNNPLLIKNFENCANVKGKLTVYFLYNDTVHSVSIG